LIDDDSITNFYNSMIIGKHQAYKDVTSVRGGVEALNYLQNCIKNNQPRPNLIFLDLNMPGMNGWEFLDAFKELDHEITKDIKVILLSTSSDPDEVNKSLNDYEVDDYINKPLSIKMLDQVFENHFRMEYKN